MRLTTRSRLEYAVAYATLPPAPAEPQPSALAGNRKQRPGTRSTQAHRSHWYLRAERYTVFSVARSGVHDTDLIQQLQFIFEGPLRSESRVTAQQEASEEPQRRCSPARPRLVGSPV